ncbi:RNA-directed DNA polymerase [Pseudoduganella lurida]|uniref:RNA-directed DNA polymerase n=1 Tax=Pseudoduganella lurida TaxID=1036180 RepID=A0A562RAM0_9BURK|nr:reverse transcriptase domain-containing protein [Pseudoduganella lurida]TWI65426.1 RNA-directed DNA polymerase [Pseudoduganella lurida]
MNPQPLHQLFDAMYHDKYRFDEFLALKPEEHYSPIPWKSRTIYKPSPTLKDFHKFITGFLLDYLPVNDSVSFAYRKGASLLQAVTPHAYSRAFFQTDLERFFESITSSLIRRVLDQASTPVADLAEHVEHIVRLLTIEGALPIGYSTSPILSNACLLGFDARLAATSCARNWIYTRYADDIIISAGSRAAINDVGQVVEECLRAELGDSFRLNQDKTKLTTIGRKVKLLGFVVLPTGGIVVDRNVRDRVETLLYFYVTDRSRLAKIFAEENDEVMEAGLERLSGLISYVHSVDEAYLEKMRIKFGSTVIDSFLHKTAR